MQFHRTVKIYNKVKIKSSEIFTIYKNDRYNNEKPYKLESIRYNNES